MSLQAGSPECRALLAETVKSSKEVIMKTMRRYSVATLKKSAMLCKVIALVFLFGPHTERAGCQGETDEFLSHNQSVSIYHSIQF